MGVGPTLEDIFAFFIIFTAPSSPGIGSRGQNCDTWKNIRSAWFVASKFSHRHPLYLIRFPTRRGSESGLLLAATLEI